MGEQMCGVGEWDAGAGVRDACKQQGRPATWQRGGPPWRSSRPGGAQQRCQGTPAAPPSAHLGQLLRGGLHVHSAVTVHQHLRASGWGVGGERVVVGGRRMRCNKAQVMRPESAGDRSSAQPAAWCEALGAEQGELSKAAQPPLCTKHPPTHLVGQAHEEDGGDERLLGRLQHLHIEARKQCMQGVLRVQGGTACCSSCFSRRRAHARRPAALPPSSEISPACPEKLLQLPSQRPAPAAQGGWCWRWCTWRRRPCRRRRRSEPSSCLWGGGEGVGAGRVSNCSGDRAGEQLQWGQGGSIACCASGNKDSCGTTQSA